MRGPVLRGALLWLVAVVAAATTGTAAVRLATSSVTDPVPAVALSPAPGPSATVDATPDPTASPSPAEETPGPAATPDGGGSATPDGDAAATPGPTSTGTPDHGVTPDDGPTPDDDATPGDDDTPDDDTPAAETTRTVGSVGGTARFRFVDGRVEVVFATPAQGFRVDVEEEGDSARVRFRSDDHESRIRADYDGGEPTVVVEEDAED